MTFERSSAKLLNLELLNFFYFYTSYIMTEPGIYYPSSLSAAELDQFLEMGWYRMGPGIFTCNYIVKDNVFYRVYWLRYDLRRIEIDNKLKKLMRRNNRFSVHLQRLLITEELEQLYADYKTGIDFDPSPSVYHWLCKEGMNDIFDSQLIAVRDHGRLIAAGVFDQGANSIAGIMNFYHPDYKKYSLGKFLLFQKMKQAIAAGKEWYYPGYLVLGMPKFDYKLFPDTTATQMYLPEWNEWVDYDEKLAGEMG
jgi:leucyl-tRNA---protein transferase